MPYEQEATQEATLGERLHDAQTSIQLASVAIKGILAEEPIDETALEAQREARSAARQKARVLKSEIQSAKLANAALPEMAWVSRY